MLNSIDPNAITLSLFALIAIAIGIFFVASFIPLLWALRLQERSKILKEQLQQAELEKTQSNQSLLEAQQKFIALSEERATLKAESEQQKERVKELALVSEQLEKRVLDAFKNLSAEALKSNNSAFLEIASNSLSLIQDAAKQDLKSREEAIGLLVKPLQDSLLRVNEQVQQIEKVREGAYQGLVVQVQSLAETQLKLRDETAHLAQSLRTPNVRGRWGEVQLRRVVELAGMSEHCDFTTQTTTFNDSEGQRRPDLLVHLPGTKIVVVDAKTPVEAYLEAVKSENDTEREEQLNRHARHIRTHIKQLGDKAYFEMFENTPEFVVLFLPGECFFSAAVEKDPSLIEFGMERHVIVATPTTLIALLRSVAYGWDQAKLSEHAREVRRLGRELFDRITGFVQHLDNVKKGLNSSVSAYNRAVGTLESRVLVSARKLGELVSKDGSENLSAEPLDAIPRSLSLSSEEDEEERLKAITVNE